MSGPHILEGLFKWTLRAPWDLDFARLLEAHAGVALQEFGFEIDELAAILGERHALTLWGLVLEDLCADDARGRNLADDYLKRRGWKESAGTRAYIKALRHSFMSLYEVSGVRRDEGFYLRDLLNGGEPVWVSEKSAARSVVQWDRVATRILTVRDKARIGIVLPFDRSASEDVIQLAQGFTGMTADELADEIRRYAEEMSGGDGELKGMMLARLKGREAELIGELTQRAPAFIFTTVWLCDLLRRILARPLPRQCNSDGEPLRPVEVRYSLLADAASDNVRKALARIPTLRELEENIWDWVGEAGDARLHAEPSVPQGSEVASSAPEDGLPLLGTLRLAGGTLVLVANSEGRASRGRALIEPVLDKLVGTPEVEMYDFDEVMRRVAGIAEIDTTRLPSDIPPDERKAIVSQALDDHYTRVLDEALPMLEDASPREAVKSATGKPKAVDWLKRVENDHARMALDDPAMQYDCTWMWSELGLQSYRRA